MIRLGGYGIDYTGDPDAYAAAHRAFGYTAAYMPNVALANREEIRAIAVACARADVVIAEGGAWRNIVAHDPAVRAANIDYACHQLAVGDEMGAGAVVCYLGSVGHPGDPWQLSDNYDYGPHPDNQSEAAFQRAVDTARHIIDTVQPRRCKFSLEMVQWLVTDTPENYLKLLTAIDRPMFGAHVDAVNMVISPRAYFHSGALIRQCVELLGPHIVSAHAKDIVMQGGPGNVCFHFDEVVPGAGNLDYAAYVTALDSLGRQVPLMLEHFDIDGYRRGLAHIKAVAAAAGVAV